MTGAGRWDGSSSSEPPSPPRGTPSGRGRNGGARARDDRSGDDRADGRRTGDVPSRDRTRSTRGDGVAARTRGEDRRAAGGDRAARGRRAAASTRSRDDEREARDDGSGPLRASWEPGRRPRALPRPPRRRMWALYLVPLLVVVTVLAVVQTVHHDEPGGADDGVAGPDSPAPIVGEAPRGSFADVNIPTAELPPGGAFPVRGRGTWHVVPGTTPQAGVGRVFTYTVEVEDGAAVPEGDAAFATAVDATLTDPRSWVGSQRIAMQRVDATSPRPPDFRVSLSSQLTTRAQCGYAIRYEASCWKPDIDRVLINGARWVRGAGAFDGQLGLYRQYAINHEVGHVFRNQHVPCPVNGGLAPVMMQQSFGTANDYLAQLTEENPQGTQIPRDGKTCQPNPWPYPEGAIAPAG